MKYAVVVLTISNQSHKGEKGDKCGKIIIEMLKAHSFEVVKYEIIPLEFSLIKEKLVEYSDELRVNMILTSGGTGFSSWDITPEATEEVIERKVPGIPEAMRSEGFKSTKKAMLSRNIAGIRGKTLIINLPGSSRGAQESLEAVVEELSRGLNMILKSQN